MRFVRLLSASLLSLLLVACGGGGSLEEGGDTGGDGSSSGSYSITVTVVDSEGNEITDENPLSRDNAAKAVATLSATSGSVSGQRIEFSLDDEIGELKVVKVETDEDGVAETDVFAGQQKGAGLIIATYAPGNISASDSFTTQGDDVVVTEETADVDVLLLAGCNAGWDDDRDNVMLDPRDPNTGCNIVNSISSNEVGEIYVEVTSIQSGDGVGSAIVNAQTSVGTILPSSGTALTDSFGRALLRLQPGNQGGAGTITAEALGVTDTTNFAVGAVNLQLTVDNGLAMDNNNNVIPLKAGGSTVIEVQLRDNEGNLFQSPTDVEFSSTCAASGQSTLDDKVKSRAGIATATYRANGCNINDNVTVTIETGGKNYTASTIIPVEASPVQSIQFMDVSEQFIALPPGEGGVPTQSVVRFKLLDEDGNPVAQDRIDFRLSDGAGKAMLTQLTGNTSNNGEVQTTVTSGVVPGSLVVKACYVPKADVAALPEGDDLTCWVDEYEACQAVDAPSSCPEGELNLIPLSEQISSVSSLLTLSSGVTDQNSFDLSTDVINSNSLYYNGVTSNLTVFFGDQFNQLSGDGVEATVLTEAGVTGVIDGTQFNPTFKCQTTDAACTIQWRSQGDRPFWDYKWGNRIGDIDGNPSTTEGINPKTGEQNCDPYFGAAAPCINGMIRAKNDPNGIVMGGRVTVTAVAKGQENFVDEESSGGVTRRNGLFDIGEYYQEYDLTEAFIDHNENGTFDKANCDPAPGPTDPCSELLSRGGHNETWRDLDNDGIFDEADGKYNGLLCSQEAEAAGECTRELIEVRSSIEMVMSGDEPYVRFTVDSGNCTTDPQRVLESTNVSGKCDIVLVNVSTGDNGGLASQAIDIYYSDEFGNPLPVGTEIELSASNGVLDVLEHTSVVGNSNTDKPMHSKVLISREQEGNQIFSGSLNITFTIPSGQDDVDNKVVVASMNVIDDQ
ncbi:Ig-like domain-containing protein [Pseudoalteromonas sp. MM17-2]|uniref:Ig-like domain-containing protein n=1 Tax=Pseudoalteromonas sp. MM17-2 TaxID=2917753 RepID=UPI001EF69016|nr:Ig-like domain-containing protein [Pseudoalteromonas sp. MM17-2]MCG7542801.1 Ig-like domain-containing protein [Pseudoalteromonas sp. MM17-2]